MKRPKTAFFPYAPSYYDNVASEESIHEESSKNGTEDDINDIESPSVLVSPTIHEGTECLGDNEQQNTIDKDIIDVPVAPEVEKQLDPKELIILPIVPHLKYIVGVRKDGPLHFSGVGNLSLLYGSISLHGYRLRIGQKVNFHSPVWQPTIRAYIPPPPPSSSQSDSKVPISYPPVTGEQVNADLLLELHNSSVTVFMLEGVKPEDQDWMTAIEDQEIYQIKPTLTGPNRQKHPMNRLHNVNLLRISSGLLGSVEETSKLPLQLSHLPKSWAASASKILAHQAASIQHSSQLADGNTAAEAVSLPPVRVLVCGAKGVGKSTLCRYIANRLMSEEVEEKVAHNLNFGGDESERETVANETVASSSSSAAQNSKPCFRRLRVSLLNCDLGQPELTPPGVLSLHPLTYPLLSPAHRQMSVHRYYHGDDAVAGLSVHFGELSSKSAPDTYISCISLLLKQCHTSITTDVLVVNMDGYVKNMGGEVQGGLVAALRPTHILYFPCSSTPSPSLPFPLPPLCPAPQLIRMEVGRGIPSRIKGAELRGLRLAGYFLGGVMKGRTRDQSGQGWSNLREEVLKRCRIRTGALSVEESSPLLCTALLSIAPVVLPLAGVLWNPVLGAGESLPPHLLWGVANGGLVGLARVQRTEIEGCFRSLHLALGGDGSTEHKQYVLHYLDAFLPAVSLGLAYVRLIDLRTASIYLTSPVPAAALQPSADEVLLLSPTPALTLPSPLVVGGGYPAYPYVSGEGAGEGSGKLRPRPNKKRRGLAQGGNK